LKSLKQKEKRLPIDVSELGLSESENSPAFYQKIDENHLKFGTQLVLNQKSIIHKQESGEKKDNLDKFSN